MKSDLEQEWSKGIRELDPALQDAHGERFVHALAHPALRPPSTPSPPGACTQPSDMAEGAWSPRRNAQPGSTLPGSTAADQPQMDFADIFPPAIRHAPGLHVFRIHLMYPVPVPPSSHGQFCRQDAYIVLQTTVAVDPSQPPGRGCNATPGPDALTRRIWTWIGPEAEMDKRFCCALYSVGLRTWLATFVSPIAHQIPGQEEPEFVRLFPGPLSLLDANEAAESGLFPVAARTLPVQLYRISSTSGQRDVVHLVRPCPASLDSGGAFLLDAGATLYVWYGCRVTLQHRCKMRMLAQRMRGHERGGRGRIRELEEEDEAKDPDCTDFMDVLRMRAATLKPVLTPGEASFSVPRAPKLYCVTGPEDDAPPIPLRCGTLLQSELRAEHCYVLDTGVELYAWIGARAPLPLRQHCNEYLARIAQLPTATPFPPWVGVHKLQQGCETEIFKLHFHGWDGRGYAILESGSRRRAMPENQPAPPRPEPDMRALFEPHHSADLASLPTQSQGPLQSMAAFVFQRRKFCALPEQAWGAFHQRDAYLYLCTYRVARSRPESPGQGVVVVEGSVKEDGPLEAVLYFWRGARAGNQALTLFRLHTEREMCRALYESHRCSVRVVLQEQGQEDPGFLAHFPADLVVHAGARGDGRPVGPRLYHLRMDARYASMRAVEIRPSCPLISGDCYLRVENSRVPATLWMGKGVPICQGEAAQALARRILQDLGMAQWEEDGSFSLRVLQEGQPREAEATPPWAAPEHLRPAPARPEQVRFFRCSAATGAFVVTRVPHFCRADLTPDVCALLDPGTGTQLLLWLGREASDGVVRQFAHAVSLYLAHLGDGRRVDAPSIRRPGTASYRSSVTPAAGTSATAGVVAAASALHTCAPTACGDALCILEGAEPLEWQAYFLGWQQEGE